MLPISASIAQLAPHTASLWTGLAMSPIGSTAGRIVSPPMDIYRRARAGFRGGNEND
jgi:hypothetical protein